MAKDAQLQPFDMDEFVKKAISPCEPSTNNSKKRIGRDGFNQRLVSIVDELTVRDKLKGMTMQNTRALVLACASGVGKTFGTLTARQGFQQQEMENGGKKRYEPVVAYIGFNCASPLSDNEAAFLGDGSVDGDTCVKVLVLSRLFAWLNGYKQLQSEKQQLGPTVLDIPDSDVQMQFRLGELMTKEDLKDVDVNDITARITQMLEEFGKQTPGLVLIVVVDEGQKLDEKRKDGARFALRYLRQLQMHMMRVKEAVRVLPVCTGINPQTHLSDAREGQNISLTTQEEVLLSPEEFDSLLHTVYYDNTRLHKWRRKGDATEQEIRDLSLFAALTWPRVRPVMEMPDKGFKIFADDSPLMWAPNTTDWDVRRMLHAAADGDYLAANFKIPTNMVRLIDSDGQQCPVIDYSVLERVGVRLLGSEFANWFPDRVDLRGLSSEGWATFENNAFRTLALFLLFFYHNREATYTMPPTGEKTSRLTNWVPESVNKVEIITLKNETCQSHPFNVQKWMTSKKLGDTPKVVKNVSKEFATALEALEVGGATLMHCKGSAPMDFILVTLEEGKTLQVRYADAKHRSNEVMSKGDVNEMLDKAEGVHNTLRELLKGQFTVPEWKDSNLLIITNSQFDDNCLESCSPPKKYELLDKVRVMSPRTTTWEPMTRVLYRSVPAPTSSVLASRPVYPVLSQLPEMTRKTWSTPPPQTGARLTRTVPVLWFVRRLKFM